MSRTGSVKAFGLISGGLDSIIAVKVLQEQGIEVTGISFETPFFNADKARKAMSAINTPLRVINITEDHLDMMKAPRYGFGKNMNPCIDCHGLMLRKAGAIMEEEGADFLFTGEVLGQRPMSQTASSLRLVAKISGYDGLILRPLSARLMPETIPESEGKVDRGRLLDIQGRSRKRQMALAEEYEIRSYPNPGGGCLLTDPGFSARLQDLFADPREMSVTDIELLKVGRHLRAGDNVKVVVGRNRVENEIIERLARPGDVLIDIRNIPGPLVLVPGGGDEEAQHKAAAICASYSDAPKDSDVEAILRHDGRERIISTRAVEREALKEMMIERRGPGNNKRQG